MTRVELAGPATEDQFRQFGEMVFGGGPPGSFRCSRYPGVTFTLLPLFGGTLTVGGVVVPVASWGMLPMGTAIVGGALPPVAEWTVAPG